MSSQETLELSTTLAPDLWSAWVRAEQRRYPWVHLQGSRAPSQLTSSWNRKLPLHCRSRTVSKMHILQQPFHFSPSGLTWRPWPLKANGKPSISSGFPPGSTSLQWQLLECVTFFTVWETAILDLSYSYLKKAIQVEGFRMHHSYREEWEHHRKTGNVNADTNDKKMTKKMFWQAVVTPHSCFHRSLLFCTNNKRTGTFLSLK